MTKLKVLVPVGIGHTDLADHVDEFKKFEQDFDVIKYTLKSKDSFIEDLKTTLNDISAIWATGGIFSLGNFNDYIDYFPPSLKVIAFTWVGYNMFDGAKLREKGIILANIGDESAGEVADTALWLTLDIFKFNSYMQHAIRKNGHIREVRTAALGSHYFDPKTGEPVPRGGDEEFNFSRDLVIGNKTLESPNGKIAGLVGLGSIGKEIAKRLSAIGLEIKYTKRTPLTEKQAEKLTFNAEYYPSVEELIPEVDLLVLAVPHTPETVNLINKDTIKLFKKGSRIVNIGRGSAIDEDVLIKALDDGTLNSVGLDVFQNEPNIDKRLLKRWDVVISPHHAAFTEQCFVRSNIKTIRNIENVLLEGGPGLSPCN